MLNKNNRKVIFYSIMYSLILAIAVIGFTEFLNKKAIDNGYKENHITNGVLEKPNLYDIVFILGIETNTLYDNGIKTIHFSNCTDLIKLLTIVNTNDIVFETVKVNEDTITCKIVIDKEYKTFIVKRL